ncbi:MAG: ATP-dependent DNA helicase RecG [Patescibacteria group bacterium]
MGGINLDDPLDAVRGIPPRFVTKLAGMGIATVRDLLWHFPTRYEDFSQVSTIADLIPNQEATVVARIVKIGSRRTWHRGLFLVEAVLADDSGEIRAVWFNQPYIRNVLQPGRLANFAGKVAVSKKEGEPYLSNPTYELVSEHQEHADTTHTARIVPIYPETRGLTSKGFRYLIQPLLRAIPPLPEFLPPETLRASGLPEVNDALRTVHFPDTLDEAIAAKRRFAFEDLFLLQLVNALERTRRGTQRAPRIPPDIAGVKRTLSGLPFTLTASQKRALWEILQDLGRPAPMNRFLQGDVGSGKTIVAAVAALEAARAGFQATFMTPTEILARQHYRTLCATFHAFGGGVALLTAHEARVWYGHGLETEGKKTALIRDIAAGKIAIVIGTHALIEKAVSFGRLALVVVDEQHRFGVSQRAALAAKGASTPHFLSMSATPIPRTLSLTLFGDLDLSLITELPKDRKPIVTRVVTPTERTATYAFIRGEIARGRQAFVICPRIEPTTNDEQWFGRLTIPSGAERLTMKMWQTLEVKSVKAEYEKLSKHIFPDLRVAMLHGKLRPKEKERVMSAFANAPASAGTTAGRSADKRTDVLVATSVVEVGVDVPNATMMMIEGAERFGLAQLYQFRGRVGRGAHQSYCFLFTDSTSEATKRRLRYVVEAKNGFELAEHDLKLRGPGQFLGVSQTGMPDLAMKALQYPDLVSAAREAAFNTIQKDPTLARHRVLREWLAVFRKTVHWE